MPKENTSVVTNRQAYRDFHIEKTYEAGLELFGNEVKSLRTGNANLKGSFCRIEGGEIFVHNMHISPYDFSSDETDPVRPRKLLLHRAQIRSLGIKLAQQGYTLVPLKVYFKRGYAKMEIGLGKGKKLYDKRQALKEKQVKREMDRIMRHKRR
ncbi:MAG: SsrA-binding protein SmpB [Candidatus Omnitrophica bacterium]|nr:SsrA-binding protein SmpB [Candidatus Omnitrophota bacterium]